MKRSSRKWKKKNKSGYRGRWKWYRKRLKKKKGYVDKRRSSLKGGVGTVGSDRQERV